MADFLPVGRVAMLEHNLTPVIHSLEDLGNLHQLARPLEAQTPFHLRSIPECAG